MKKDNLIQEKSYKFAIKIVKLYQYLVKDKTTKLNFKNNWLYPNNNETKN